MLEITLIQLANYLPSDLKGTIQLEQLAYILSDAHDFLLEVTEAIPPHVIPAMFVTQELPRDSGLRHFQKENVRHAFFHVRLSEVEMTDLASALRAAGDRGVKLSPDLLSLLARYVQYFKRKDAAKYVECSVDNCLKVAEFRRAWYPIRDTERALREDLETGALYWFGRDRNYHPGLFCHLRKLSALPAPRMLRLMLFVFEWGRQFMRET
ncbi:MAG: uncharacterized protein KVP18_002081 [Porospora cf. gigantea A]|uniref:uncharacterized protein n=1 Tax=Porospora cf. gigantea A TaxID=2853593 RepID=UPI003559C1A9|nr:MAG: hypothetical protein KVP18_002081 [Porospora cf. gigantea A]